MKETKVYVDELPESCFECPIMVDGSEGCDFCVCAILEEKATTKNRLKDCPLQSIKDHNRELVAKVLESVKNEAYKDGFYDEDGNKIITYHINNYILDQIQKEYEK